jgi:hypothetical protein
MMAPHPNYPTLEFASIGTAVVTTKYANKQNLDRYSGNIIMSDIASDSMAGAIRIAAGLSYDTRIENLKSNTIEGSWEKSLGDVLQRVLKKL